MPGVYALDWEAGWLLMEWVEGGTLRGVLDGVLVAKNRTEGDEEGQGLEREEELRDLMSRVGEVVGRMHAVGVVHGDLTTSNLMLRPLGGEAGRVGAVNGMSAHDSVVTSTARSEQSLDGDVVIIDFGLAAQSTQEEDRAVDLYVLERAFGSTHPKAEGLFREVLRAYGESYGGARVVLKRLEEVRLRGRKRSMLG